MTQHSGRREPLFNLPGPVVAACAVLIGVHLLRLVLTPEQDLEILARFAFVPDRLQAVAERQYLYPGGSWADAASFVSYALLHADIFHLGVNLSFFAAFGAVIVRRFGTVRFVLLCLVSAIGAAMAHWAAHVGEATPVIGASGIVSGLMGALARFGFEPGGPMRVGGLGARGADALAAARVPAPGLTASLTDGRVLQFVAVFLVMNLVIVFGAEALTGPGGGIAWEAHVGGFMTGFLAFSLLDPVDPRG
ncbi:rhomboid family intramembrane serine protease [Prosthecomicrobium sp. N25]|uniref:rhomboid family intramembrane serine protease n=1 Tax=Prosthecomicrobium sp. N25 TaxID=3129254 RepID=UPI0030786FFA